MAADALASVSPVTEAAPCVGLGFDQKSNGRWKARRGVNRPCSTLRQARVVLPKAVRERLRLRPGARLEVAVNGRAIVLREVGSVSETLAGLGREIWRGIDAVKYVRKERSGWER